MERAGESVSRADLQELEITCDCGGKRDAWSGTVLFGAQCPNSQGEENCSDGESRGYNFNKRKRSKLHLKESPRKKEEREERKRGSRRRGSRRRRPTRQGKKTPVVDSSNVEKVLVYIFECCRRKVANDARPKRSRYGHSAQRTLSPRSNSALSATQGDREDKVHIQTDSIVENNNTDSPRRS